ncbi:MAG: thrombospondin type 3 repeat-containing protein [Nitrosopumilus sp.]|nr:thrombospondin type 3 repeat-containing protein [Nitrosopumilus sp.]
MRCEEFNEIWINSGGSILQVASFSERETIFIDEQFQNQLALTANGRTVDDIHIKLFLECDGNAMEGSTIVSGTVKLRERIESPTVFFLGNDRPISTYSTQTITPVALEDSIKKEIFEYIITKQVLNNVLASSGDGSKHFKSEMLPKLKFDFNHPQVGVFSGAFDTEQFGKPIVTQFAFSFVNDIVQPTQTTSPTTDPNLDTDGDGKVDSIDVCPLLPETVNGYNDNDGCPDSLPDTDGDGIIDANDSCPIQPENFNGITDSDGCPDSSPTPLDTDGDGIEDLLDLCVGEKETFNGVNDGDGCPDTVLSTTSDSDGDGIPDNLDECPMEEETFNGVNDSDGCPDTVQSSTTSGSESAETSVGDTSLGSTQVIPFQQVSDDDPSGIIIIAIIFVGFIGSVVVLNKLRKK